MIVTCPHCGGEFQPTWDWCHRCGFDPDGRRPLELPRPPEPPASRGTPVAAIVGGVAIGLVLAVVAGITAVTLRGRISTSETSTSTSTRTTAAPTTTAPPVWSPWSPADGSFGVELPGTPTIEPYTDIGPQWSSAQSAGVVLDRKGQRGYAVSWWDLKADYGFGDPEKALNAVTDHLDADPDILLTRRQFGSFAGHPSTTFTATVTDGTAIRGVNLLVGSRAYQLTVAAPAGEPTEYERFVASFHLN